MFRKHYWIWLTLSIYISVCGSLDALAPHSQAAQLTINSKLGKQIASLPSSNYPKAHKKQHTPRSYQNHWIISVFKPFGLNHFFEPAFPKGMVQQWSQWGPKWKKFAKDQKKIFSKARFINVLMGLFTFSTTLILMVFVLTEGLTISVAIIWLLGLLGLIATKVLFDRLMQHLFEDFSFRFEQLLQHEKIKYSQSRMANPKIVAALESAQLWRLPFWANGQIRVIDVFLSFFAVVIAISILNPWLLLIFIPLFLIMLKVLGSWANNKNNTIESYRNASFALAQNNRIINYLGLPHKNKDISQGLLKRHQTYLNTKSRYDAILRLSVLLLLPLLGIILYFVFGLASAPLLLYIVALNFFGLFQLLDFLTVAHNGMATRKAVEDFSDEISDHPLIIQNHNWPKRVNDKDSLKAKDIQALELMLNHFYEEYRKVNGHTHIQTLKIQHQNVWAKRSNITAILGKSGSGKTSLLQLLASMLSLNAPDITIGPHSYKSQGRLNAYRSDEKAIAIDPSTINYQQLQKLVHYVSLDHFQEFKSIPPLTKSVEQRYRYYKKKLIPEGNPNESTASSGELVRIQLALILATNQAPFLMLDQPLQSLDPDHQNLVLKMLKQYAQKKHVAIVLTSPELNVHSPQLRLIDHTVALGLTQKAA